MRVALLTEFASSRKDPLGGLVERIHRAFADAGLDEPTIEFSMGDAPIPGFVSSVDRVLKRYPALQRFVCDTPPLPNLPAIRRITNAAESPASGARIDFATLAAIAAGVPRSFPFHSVAIRFQSPVFGDALAVGPMLKPVQPGIHVGDSWWVNGRSRSLMAFTSVEAEIAGKQLPPLPARVAAVLAACGKVTKTVQVPLAGQPGPDESARPAVASAEAAQAIGQVIADYRARLAEVVERARLPHDLPSAREVLTNVASFGQATGPKKPVLVRAFKPMGYDCRGESGTFTLRRRTASNLTAEIHLDVGTWSRSLTAGFSVKGLGFTARLPLPVSRNALDSRQYQIGDAERWQKIVDNLAALVAEYDRSFVPAIEAAAGPSPEWFTPES